MRSAGRFKWRWRFPNNRGLLRPGGFAKASILTDRSATASIVPIESVVKFAGVTKLFVVEAGKARSINVETGNEGLGWIEVIGSVPKDAEVVTTGQTQLADETTVTIRKPEATAAARRSHRRKSKILKSRKSENVGPSWTCRSGGWLRRLDLGCRIAPVDRLAPRSDGLNTGPLHRILLMNTRGLVLAEMQEVSGFSYKVRSFQ